MLLTTQNDPTDSGAPFVLLNAVDPVQPDNFSVTIGGSGGGQSGSVTIGGGNGQQTQVGGIYRNYTPPPSGTAIMLLIVAAVAVLLVLAR